MREEVKDSIQMNLDNYVQEEFNDTTKGNCCGLAIENPFRQYYKGWLYGVCMALNLTMDKEGDEWVIRNGRRTVIARSRHDEEDD